MKFLKNNKNYSLSFFIFILFVNLIGCYSETTNRETLIYETQSYDDKLYQTGELDPSADKRAVKGGKLRAWGSAFPKSLNYWTEPTSFNGTIMSLLFDSLLNLHSTEDKYVGILAEKWEISSDKKTFLFSLRPQAKWSDGKSITSDDFIFYYDTIMNPSNLTAPHKVGLKRLKRPVKIDDFTFSVTAKEIHWANFNQAASLLPLPKHLWEGSNFNQIHFDFPVVSGPYRIKTVKKNRRLELIRNTNWWGEMLAYNKYKYNFDSFLYRFVEDRTKALQAFQRGDFDVYPIYTSSIWHEQTLFPAVKKGWVSRENIYNHSPVSFQGMAVNLRKKKFKDIRVRKALAYLLDREIINDKLMYNQYFLLNSFFPDLYPNYQNAKVPIIKYDEERARKLLAEVGYDVNSEGKLVKDENPLTLTFLTFSADTRHLELYINSLRKVGIVASIEKISLATLRTRIQNFDYEIYWAAWGGARLKDPETLWHGDQADKKGSYNIPGYKNAKVDQLIEQQKTEFDISRRNEILRQIDAYLVADIPYLLLWQNDHHRLLYWNYFGTPTNRFAKYDNEAAINVYWWYEGDLARKTVNAKKDNLQLKMINRSVRYENIE